MSRRSRNGSGLGEGAFAVIASLMILFATPGVAGAVTLSGGTSTAADAGGPPGVSVPDAVVDDASDSTIEVGYNVTGVIAANDTLVRLTGPANLSVSNGSLGSAAGVATLTIPADVYGGGNLTVAASVVNASTGAPVANDTATLSVVSNAKVTGFGLSSYDVEPDETVTVSALADNAGNDSADVTVALYEDGVPVDSTRVTVPGGGSTEVSFDRTYAETGSHTLAVNTLPGQTVNVTNSTGGIYVSGYVVPKTTVNVSESFPVNATVENTGDTEDWVWVEFYRDGLVVDARNVTVGPSNSTGVEFRTNFSTAGTHTVNVTGGEPTAVNVTTSEDDGGSDLSVIDQRIPRTTVNTSESFWVNATVENTGDAEGSMWVDLYHDGVVVDSRGVTVPANTSAVVPFSTNFTTSGNHTVNVTDRSPTTVEVLSDSDSDSDGAAAPDLWTQFQYDTENTGHNPTAVGPKQNPAVSWKFPATAGPAYAQPLVSGDLAAFGSGKRVYAVDARTGAERWNATIDASTDRVETIGLVGGELYVRNSNDTVFVFDSSTGRELRNFTVTGEDGTLVDGIIYTVGGNSSYGRVAAVNASTGDELWSITGTDNVEGVPAVTGDRVYVGRWGHNASVQAINRSTGEIIWTQTVVEEGFDEAASSPAVADGKVFFGTVNQGSLFALEAKNGTQLWRADMRGNLVSQSPLVANGAVFVGSSAGDFMAVNTSNGSRLWNFTVHSDISSSGAIVNGVAYFGTEDYDSNPGRVYAVDADTGATIWERYVGGETSPLAVVDNTLYVANGQAGELVAISGSESLPSNVSVVSTSVSDTSVNTSEDVVVNATVQNAGNRTEWVRIDLFTDGDFSTARETFVNASSTETVSFVTNFSTTGTHSVNVTGGTPTPVNVTSDASANLSVAGYSLSKTTVNVSEPLHVDAFVENTGTVEGSMWVEFYRDGAVVDAQEVTVGPSNSTLVEFVTNFSTTGTHSVNVTDRTPTPVNVTSGSDGDGGTANLSIVDYAVSKNPVNVSETFWVNATVANGGDAEGSRWVELYHDGWIVDGTEVTVAPNATATASFLTNFTTSGNHTVNVTDRSPTTVEVLGDDDGSKVTVDYDVSATTVNTSESFRVNATVHNGGTNDTTETVTLYADGSPVDSATVNVSAGTNETVSFSHSFSTDGTHTVTVDDLVPTEVEVLGDSGGGDGTPSIAVTDVDVSKWHVDTNETVTVTASVENQGSAAGTETIEFFVAGLATDSRSVSLDAGNSTTVSFSTSFDAAGNYGVWVTGWAEHVVEVSDGGPSGPYVVTGEVTHVGGTAPDMSQVVLSGEHTGLYQVQLRNGTADGSDLNRTYDLDGIGVDESTEFRIDVTLNGSVPRLLLGNGKNVSWTRSRNADGTWNVTIYARGSHVESIFGRSTSPWPTGENDTADTFHNVSVSLAIDSLDAFDQSKRDAMNGTVFATDAQQFSSPRYTPPGPGQSPELSLYVAGPHYGVNGSTNRGYFDAFVPDAMLAEWNVSEPSELAGSYQGSQSAITAWSVPGGMRVELDVHYSDGDVSIVKSDSLQTGYLNGTVTNGTGGPIAGATVTVRNATTGQTAASVTTDASGNYSASLTNGTYDVTASASGYENASHSGVSVTAGSTTDSDFTLGASTAPGTIEGTILNGSDDTPIAGASVAVSNASGTVATTTTDSKGVFTASVSAGSYNVSVSADGYVGTTFPGVQVTSGQTTRFTGRLTPASNGSTGFVNGTVTNASGPVAGATVTAYGPTSVQTTTTDASGNYSVAVEEGFVGLEYSAPGHGVHSEFVEATAGNTTRVDVTLREPGTITGTVVDENGDPIAGATVDVWGPSSGQTTTDASGNYSLSVGAGEYAVEIRASGYPSRIVRGVSVNVSETETVNARLRQPGFVTGTVVDAQDNPLSNVWVGAEDGATLAYATTNASGHFNVSAVPGNYSVTGFGPNGEMVSVDGTVRVTEGNATDVGTLTSVNPRIVDSDVRHVGGTRPDMANVSLNAQTFGGMLMVQLTNASGGQQGMPVDLSDLGADDTTRFEITLTVEDYDPNALLWGARNVSWSATPNATDPNATDITIRTNTVHLAGIEDKSLPVGPITRRSPDDIRWPTGAEDRADLGWNNTVYFMLYDLGSMPSEVSRSLDNMTVVTNAQTFSRPQMVNGTLRVYAAGPHYTERGATHDGFYSAFIPDAQLAEWNVTDPEGQLEVSWQGDDESFTVEETPDGAWIHLDIHYSDGYAEVTPGDTTAPTADAGADRTVEEDTVVSFDGSASSDDTGVESYAWDFGDGTTATGVSSSHTFAEPGTYTVTLTVTDAAGNSDTDALTVTVEAAGGGDGAGGGGGGGGGAIGGGGATADVDVTGRTLLNDTVDAGSDVVVRVELANYEPVRGRIELALAVDGSVAATREVAVGASSERTVFLGARLGTPGTYAVTVDGVEVGSVTVIGEPAPNSPTPDAASTPDTTPTAGGPTGGSPSTATPTVTAGPDATATPDDPTTPAGTSSGSGAGFGPALALGALLAAGLLASRRRG